jgi:hypothetical protein
MFALIKQNQIVGCCESLNDVNYCLSEDVTLSYVEVPDDFTVHEYTFDAGVVRRKTEIELFREAALTDVRSSRAIAYPPITDYLDAVVKGDQAQIDAYVASCLAVKAKYPKPPEA